jgi:beta-glucanase (GH16 family)
MHPRRLLARRFRALTALTGLAVVATSVTIASSGAGASGAPNCGATIHKSNGTAWTCTLDDEFNGSTLNTATWTPYTSVAGGFRGGAECYTPRNVKVSAGSLLLPTTRAAAPFSCAGRTADYYSGMITSKTRFTQTYGRYQIRAKVPMSKGLHAAFWLLPQNPYHSNGLDYGEIDVMESGGAYRDIASPHLHYVSTPGNPQSGAYCSVPNMATQFHTYTLEWNARTITMSYDGRTCWSTGWQTIPGFQPPGARSPEPFDQPFYIILNMGTDTAQTIPANAVSPSTDLSQPFQVDYIRVWK